MAFNISGNLYPELSAALDALEAEGLPYLAAVQDPNGLHITETLTDGQQARMLVGGILAWFIRDLVEREGSIAAREWLDHAFEVAHPFLQEEFAEGPS